MATPDSAEPDPVAGPARTQRAAGYRQLFSAPYAALAIGVLLLELTTAFTVYISAAVTPPVIADLDAARLYPLVLSAGSVGLFTGVALAGPAIRHWPARRLLITALVLSVGGTACSAAAPDAVLYAAGRLLTNLAGGVLGIFGVSTAIKLLPQQVRLRLIALTSAVWIVPGMIGPTAALALYHMIGWRLTLLVPVPLVLAGRVLLGRAAQTVPTDRRQPFKPAALLLPAGMAIFVGLGSGPAAPAGYLGLLIALVGGWALLPRGTYRAVAGPQRSVAVLGVVSIGFFGLDGLLPAIGQRASGVGLTWPLVSVGLAATAWSLGAAVLPRLTRAQDRAATTWLRAGLMIMFVGCGLLTVLIMARAVTGWQMVMICIGMGFGMGLCYPTIFVRASTPPSRSGADGLDATALGTAVVLSEQLGGQIGVALGAGLVTALQQLGTTEAAGLRCTPVIFSGALLGAVLIGLLPDREAGADAAQAPQSRRSPQRRQDYSG